MTPAEAKVDALMTARRAAKATHCNECGCEVEFPCESETRAAGKVKQCFECWWKRKVAAGEEKWWTKPEFSGKQ